MEPFDELGKKQKLQTLRGLAAFEGNLTGLR